MIRVIVLRTFDLDEYVFGAPRAGASGFMLKDAPEDHLLAALRIMADGGALFSPGVTRRLIERFAQLAEAVPRPEVEDLTPREGGLTLVARLLQKLGLRDRTQAVILAYESGFVRPGVS